MPELRNAGAPCFVSQGCDPDSLELLEAHGSEALGEPFAFELTLASPSPELDLHALLRSPACLRLRHLHPELPDLPYHGMLERFEQLHSTPSHTLYRARLVPRLQRLALCRHSRSFTTERSVPDTLRQLLLDSGIHPLRMQLRASYRPRNFLCQYDESDLDFLHRWLQREGLFYLFEHGPDAESLLLLDHHELLPPDTLDVAWQPLPHLPGSDSHPAVHDWHALLQPLPRQLVLHQRNHRKAAVELSVRRTLDPDGLGELVLEHLDFRDHDEGRHYADILAQQLRCRAQRFLASSSCRGMRCGQTLRLRGHPRADFNRSYLVTRVTHHATRSTPALPGRDNAYSCQLELIDLALPFRPQPTIAWPRIAGTVCATVLADPGNPYAQLDPHGRYAIRLHFDSASPDSASPGSSPNAPDPQPPARVRMATPYAGSHHGLHLPLLAGTEVLVAFRDGDPDQPLITAAVPNSENPSLARHDNAFIHQLRTAGGNALLLDDRDGRQALRMHSPSSNSSLSLGSSSPDSDSAGVHIATEGDFINVVAGMRSDFQAGGSNSATLGATGNLSAGARSSIELGPVLHWSAGWALGWSAGTDATHSNQGWALQTPRAELGADQELALRAGLRPEARDALRALRVDCGTAALTGAASSLALSTVLFETLHTGPVQGAAAPGARGGAAAAGCLAFGVAARALIGSYSQRAEKLLQDAQASECVLQREQLQLRHQPGWAALERGLRMDAGGTTLEASVQRGAPDKANAWRQGPLQTRAVAGDAALDIDAAMALLKVSIAQAGKLELREAGLGVARGPRCRLGIHASGRVVLCATLLSIRPENELDLG